MNILEELAALRLADMETLAHAEPASELERRVTAMPPAMNFATAFSGEGLHVIAELKKASPSRGLIRPEFDAPSLAAELVEAGAAALSVLCEPHRFLGDDTRIQTIRATTPVPILYKDFISCEYHILRARAVGADAILLIASALPQESLERLLAFACRTGLSALVETHTAEEIARAADAGADVIGVNCRDLRTFRTDTSITAELLCKIPSGIIKIAESGLRTAADLAALHDAGANGFLIGETLMRDPHPGEKLKEMTK